MRGSCITELPILSRGPTHCVDVYQELVIYHDVSTQADVFLVCSSPKKLCTPVSESNSAVSFTDDMLANIILLLLWLHYMILYRLQQEYYPTDDTTKTKEEQAEEALKKEKKFIFLNPAFSSCWSNAIVVVKKLSLTFLLRVHC